MSKRSAQQNQGAVAAKAATRASKRPKVAANASLAEGNLAGDAGKLAESELEKHRLDNIFWEKFDTRLLAAWLSDYPDHTLQKSKMSDRNALISYLVQNGAARPDGQSSSHHLAHMRMIFKEQHSDWNGPLPGLNLALVQDAPPTLSRSRGADSTSGNELEEDTDVEMTLEITNTLGSPAPSAKKQLAFGSAQSVATTASVSRLALKPPASHSAHSAPASLLYQLSRCATCLTAAADPTATAWLCLTCGLRGDLSANDPANIALNAQRVAQSSRVVSYAASSSGQSQPAETAARETGLSALDREYDKQAKRGETFALFAGPKAAAPLLHTAALRTVRTTPSGPATQQPSEQLIELIRSGKFKAVGHAIPRPLDNNAIEDGMPEVVGVGADGTLKAQSKAFVPPAACSSSAQFSLALVSTILPSLIDRPAAAVQWMALARTALELEKIYDWPTASAYVAQLLNERIPMCEPFNTISSECLNSVQLARARRPGPPSPPRIDHHQQQNSANRNQQHQQHVCCWKWNNSRCEGPCKYQHVCSECRSADHPCAKCPKASSSSSSSSKPRQQGKNGKSGGRDGKPATAKAEEPSAKKE
jgi:hypothetical protein